MEETNQKDTFKDIYKGVDQKKLESLVSDYHITEISSLLTCWEDLAPFIGLTESEQVEITEDFVRRPDLQRRKALSLWKLKSGDDATYKSLIDIFCLQGQLMIAETIVRMLTSPEEFRDGSRRLVTRFRQELLSNYSSSSAQHPSQNHLSSDMLHSEIYVDLKLFKCPLSEIAGNKKVSGTMGSTSRAVTFGDVFADRADGKRLIVLFEGVVGCGKSTLCWHLRRKWARNQLLQQFHLLIHIDLNDPQVQSATGLADFILNTDKRVCEEVVSYILDLKGERVCFLLDGLDEASPTLLSTVFDLIKGRQRVQLSQLSFIITTRPNSRIVADMKSVLDSRIAIGGFDVAKLHDFIDTCLGSLHSERTVAKELFIANPSVEQLCTLPVHAVAMAHLVQSDSNSASYNKADLYQFILTDFLNRHMLLRTDQKMFRVDVQTKKPFTNPDQCLPPQIRDPFKQMCLLAYEASIKGKECFSLSELGLPQLKVDNVLGVLQIERRVTMMGERRYYSFSSPFLQEFLAAVHVVVVVMKRDGQTSSFDVIKKSIPVTVLELTELLMYHT